MAQPGQALAPQEAGDRRGAELERLGDLRAGPALPAQALHPAYQQRRGRVRTPLQPTRAIRQACRGLGRVARDPLAHRAVLTPTAAATASGASCRVRTRSTIWPRLRGVVRAFL
jgi:hypothetical protein